MKITVQIEATADININLNDDNLIEIMKNYNGDFQKWAKDNHSEYLDYNDFDIDFKRCYYDTQEAEELLQKSKEVLGVSEDGSINNIIVMRTILKKSMCDIPNIEQEIEELIIDVDLVYKAVNFVDFKNPKAALNYIHLDGNTISATNTKILFFADNHKYSFDNLLFPPYFLEPLKNGGKCYIDNSGDIFLKYENNWYSAYRDSGNFNFPDIQRILLNDEAKEKAWFMPFRRFSSNSITQQYVGRDKSMKLIKFKVYDKDCFIKEEYYNFVIGLHEDLETVYATSHNYPVHFEGNNIKVVVMSTVV